MKRYYLGLNANGPSIGECLFGRGSKRNLRELNELLAGKYQGTPILCKNGRSALALALKAYLNGGDKIIINGFTCYAVYEAVVGAGMTPIFADINEKDLNFDVKTLEKLIATPTGRGAKGIIVQNTLGNTVDMEKIEKFAKSHGLVLIEDLAHSAGAKYYDGREVGTVGAATVLSFGKDKAINTITGGAAILRSPQKNEVETPFKTSKISETLRARLYPLFCGICRGLNHVHLGGIIMRFFLATHLVEKSADSRLDIRRKPPKFIAKMAIQQIKSFHHRGQPAIREFCLVKNRTEVLSELRKAGYFFDALWYEKPVSPERYYKNLKFPEKQCPVAVEVASKIINLPKYYKSKDLNAAMSIIKPYLVEDGDE